MLTKSRALFQLRNQHFGTLHLDVCCLIGLGDNQIWSVTKKMLVPDYSLSSTDGGRLANLNKNDGPTLLMCQSFVI